MSIEILVRGEGEASALPDRAVVRVMVEGDGSSQQDAYTKAAGAARDVDAIFERHASGFARKMTASLAVFPKTRWKKGEALKSGWRASRSTVLEVTDLKSLGVLVAELSASGVATIQGPTWQLNPDNDVHERARREAVADARRRAQAYIAELGLKLHRIAWLSEPGLRVASGQVVPMVGTAGTHSQRSLAATGEESIDVAPDEITVRAVVEMGVEAIEIDTAG
jgi:uncharacterized protein YggE